MFKLILYIFIFYLVYQFIKLILVLSKSKARQEHFFKDEPKTKKEGETTIQYIPENNKRDTSEPPEKDEYIDYQELK